MAVQVTTIRKILDELNGEKDKNTPWAEMPGIYFLTAVIKDIPPGTQGVALKGFINKETGEIKTYLAKWLDVPETKDIP